MSPPGPNAGGDICDTTQQAKTSGSVAECHRTFNDRTYSGRGRRYASDDTNTRDNAAPMTPDSVAHLSDQRPMRLLDAGAVCRGCVVGHPPVASGGAFTLWRQSPGTPGRAYDVHRVTTAIRVRLARHRYQRVH